VTGDARERAALAWLYGFADQERGVGWNPRASPAEQWKLGRTRALLDLAGAPDRRLVCVLVGGTKGKGSTCALLASILHAAGVRAGLYTKPHLQTYRERIRVDGAALSPAEFADAVDRFPRHVADLVRRHPEAGAPTTFEVTTALALEVFARAGCRVAVVEVGLGGRLDATNALAPALSVIAPISRDHTEVLGRTLEAIAAEKAGILRPGRPGLLAEQRPAAARALARACRRLGARCEVVPPLPVAGERPADQQVVLVPAAGAPPAPVRLPLAGAHQRQNAALAVAAARALAREGIPIGPEALARGIEQARWPGRFEVVPGRPPVVLDGAHNDASALALASTLRAYAGALAVHLVLGINRESQKYASVRCTMCRIFVAGAASVRATAAAGNPRALAPERLAGLCRRLTPVSVQAWPTAEAALRAACAEASTDGVVCVAGSLAVVGQARDALGLPPPERLWDRPPRDPAA
jgi:dihydrofolate synthase/folylpolyglutamate synthase